MTAAVKLAAVPALADNPTLLSPQQLCERIPGLTIASLATQRSRGGGPPFMKSNARVVLYDWDQYLAWLRESTTTQTDRYGERP
jgi:hypothetical protein